MSVIERPVRWIGMTYLATWCAIGVVAALLAALFPEVATVHNHYAGLINAPYVFTFAFFVVKICFILGSVMVGSALFRCLPFSEPVSTRHKVSLIVFCLAWITCVWALMPEGPIAQLREMPITYDNPFVWLGLAAAGGAILTFPFSLVAMIRDAARDLAAEYQQALETPAS